MRISKLLFIFLIKAKTSYLNNSFMHSCVNIVYLLLYYCNIICFSLELLVERTDISSCTWCTAKLGVLSIKIGCEMNVLQLPNHLYHSSSLHNNSDFVAQKKWMLPITSQAKMLSINQNCICFHFITLLLTKREFSTY